MADTITEFINVTGKTLTELQSGLVIVSNAANEQAVIKDLLIANPSQRALVLKDDPATLLTTSDQIAAFSGSELLGASASLVLSTTSLPFIFNGFISPSASNTVMTNTFPSVFFGETGSKSVTGSQSSAAVTSFSANPNFALQIANGDFYYASQLTASTLYRRAGGFNGTETSFASFGDAIAYDGSRYIYGASGGTLKTFDTQTNTVTNTVTMASGLTAGGGTHIAAMDGMVWLHQAYNTASWLVNPATGAITSFGGFATASAQRYFVGMNKNTAGDYILVQTDYITPQYYWWNAGPNITSPTLKASGTITGLAPAYSGNYNRLFRIPGLNNYLFNAYNTQIAAINLTTLSVEFSRSLSGTTDYTYGLIPTYSSAQAVADFGTVAIRATGIKTTP